MRDEQTSMINNEAQFTCAVIYSAQVTERLDCTDLQIIYLVLRMFRLENRKESSSGADKTL